MHLLHSSFVCVWVLIFLEFCCHLQYGEARRGGGRGGRPQSGMSESRRSKDSRVPYEWCPPCDVSHCPPVSQSSCQHTGRIELDLCHCCPICVSNREITGTIQNSGVMSGTSHHQPGAAGIPQGPNFDYEMPDPDLSHQTANQSEACAKITCPKFQMCMLNIQDLPMCRCPTKFLCMKSKRRPVCGEDNITYKSKCFLKMAECESGKNIASYKRGKCATSEKDNQKREERLREKEEKRREREEKRRLKKEKMDKRRKKKDRKEKKERRRNRQQKRFARQQKVKI